MTPRGALLLMALGAALFVPAAQLLGALALVVMRDMGPGFPREAMAPLAEAWGALIPGTSYMQLRSDQSLRATPVETWALSLL